MDSYFEDSIFGELVLPTPSSKQCPQQQQSQCSGPSADPEDQEKITHMRKLETKGLTYAERESDCETASNTGSNSSGWAMNFHGTKSKVRGNQTFLSERSALEQNLLFSCPMCQQNCKVGRNFHKQCVLCKGKGELDPQNSFLKFISYMIEFKTGRKDSYPDTENTMAGRSAKNSQRGKVLKSRLLRKETFKNENQNLEHSEPDYPQFSSAIQSDDRQSLQNCLKSPRNIKSGTVISYSEFKQKLYPKENVIQECFVCNLCEVCPIEGTRYHCSHEDCENDYDLCSNCFTTIGHQHKMQELNDIEVSIRRKKSIAQKIFASNAKVIIKRKGDVEKCGGAFQEGESQRVCLSAIH